jgi:transposase
MQCACAIMSSVACTAVQFFFTLSHKRDDFRKKKLLNIKYFVSILSTNLSETFLTVRRTEQDMKYYTGLHVKYPLVLSDFNET